MNIANEVATAVTANEVATANIADEVATANEFMTMKTTNENTPVMIDSALVAATIADLEARIASLGSVIVAFSGGVDSSVVAAIAFRALGDRALAVTAVSAALATGELDGARSVAAAVGINHEVISTDELARAGYRENGIDRCYHCKSELYDRLSELASNRGFAAVLSGANADDVGEWRPGLTAAAEHEVVHPLLLADVGKDLVRAIAQFLDVPSAAKPASPCLASRVPHGTPVDPQTLDQIDRAELGVRALGYGELRVRHYGELAKIELSFADLQRGLSIEGSAAISTAVKAVGYRHVAIDTEPFRSGNLTIHLLPTRRRA